MVAASAAIEALLAPTRPRKAVPKTTL
jgi:hypothetical protein